MLILVHNTRPMSAFVITSKLVMCLYQNNRSATPVYIGVNDIGMHIIVVQTKVSEYYNFKYSMLMCSHNYNALLSVRGGKCY